MPEAARHDAWQAGDSYELYMGRWSRQLAPHFLDWLDAKENLDWLDVGCGTGALSSAILSGCSPKRLISIDPSEGFIATARQRAGGGPVEFKVGDAQALPVDSDTVDVIVSGLVLNFVPDRQKALAEMRRVARRDATIAFYVWDYPAGGIGFIRQFWNAATALDTDAAELTEDRRFPFCTPDALTGLARSAGLADVDCVPIEVPTVFRDFDDFWRPFTLGAGPAPGYCASLDDGARERLRERLQQDLPRNSDGSIPLKAKAWAVRGTAA
jgi:SAM-dependent methyltransferase